MATRKRRDDVQTGGTGGKDTMEWKFHNGTHLYVRTNKLGYSERVLGVAATLSDQRYVACMVNDFASYRSFDELEQAKVHVAALAALQGDTNEIG